MPARKLPPNDVLISMYNSGLSTGEIAEKLGNVKPVTVSCMLKSLGVRMRTAAEADALARKKGKKKVPRYWTGKKQPKEMVESRISKIRGENHYLWKDGKSRTPYREMIKKVKCEVCPSTNQLGIHHKDGNHYNNVLENLQVLCASCHSRIHKIEFWEQVRSGERPAPSTTNLSRPRDSRGCYASSKVSG